MLTGDIGDGYVPDVLLFWFLTLDSSFDIYIMPPARGLSYK